MSFDPASLIGSPVGEFKLTGLLSSDGPVLRYHAVHQKLKRSATCHVLDPSLAATQGEAFRLIMSRISQVRQRNLIDIFDSGVIGASPYFLSEQLSGQPLPKWLARHRWSVAKLHVVVQQLGQALSALHGANIRLEEISPHDIYLQRQGRTLHLKLVGFVAGKEPPKSQSDSAAVSGEQAAIARLVLGLCQRKPPSLTISPGLASAEPLLDPTLVIPGIGDPLESVLRKVLRPSAEKPFSSPQELFSALLAAIPARSPRPSLMELVRGLKKQPRWMVAPLAVLLGLAVWLGLRNRPVQVVAIQRTYTVRALHELAQKTLQAGLRSSEATVREQSLRGLRRSSDIGWRSLVEPLLDDPALAVQLQAAEVLGGLGTRRAIPALQAHLRSDFDPALRAACTQALRQLGESVSGAEVPQQAGDDSVAALSFAAERGDGPAIDKLLARMPKKPPLAERELAIAEILLRQEVPAARTLLIDTAKQKGPTQLAAAQILCRADEFSFQQVLRDALADSARPLEERQLAASGLQFCGDRSDGMLLARIIDHPRENVLLKQGCAGALLRLTSLDPELLTSQGVEWAKQALDDDNWSVRESAVALLGESEAVTQPHANKRTEGAKLTAALTQVIELLGRALQDQQRQVRMAAMRSAVKIVQKTSDASTLDSIRQSIRKRLSEGDAEEQIVAAASLARMGDSSARETLYKGLRSTEVALRRRAMEEAGTDSMIPPKLLLSLVADRDFAVRFGAAALLVEKGQRQASLLTVLHEAVQRGGGEGVRAYALLQKVGDLSTADESKGQDLGTLLASPDVLQRLMAIDALQTVPSAEAAPLLLKATRDPDATVRFRLVEVVARHCSGTDRSAWPALVALAEDADVAVRARAMAILGPLQLAPPPSGTTGKPATDSKATAHAGEGDGPAVADSATPTLTPEVAKATQAIEQQFAQGSTYFKQGKLRFRRHPSGHTSRCRWSQLGKSRFPGLSLLIQGGWLSLTRVPFRLVLDPR